MNVFAKTDVGKARNVNEDFYDCASQHDEIQLYILADGMGGYNGGEIASSLATSYVKSYIKTHFSQMKQEKEDILKLIKDAMEYANMVVYEKAKETKRIRKYGYYFRSLFNI